MSAQEIEQKKAQIQAKRPEEPERPRVPSRAEIEAEVKRRVAERLTADAAAQRAAAHPPAPPPATPAPSAPATALAPAPGVEHLAQGSDRLRPMRRALRCELHAQLGGGDLDVGGGGEGRVEERPALVVGALVMRRDSAKQIALGLVGDHLEHVGQVLPLGGELDHLRSPDGRVTGRPRASRRACVTAAYWCGAPSRFATRCAGRRSPLSWAAPALKFRTSVA
jgi:hypothetical protein